MPRKYKPDPHSTTRYRKYDDEVMRKALEALKEEGYRSVSAKFGIPKTVLHRHNTKDVRKQGGQTVLSGEIEDDLIQHINTCAEWGYPLDTLDLRIIVKGYLDRCGKTIQRFKNNLPGRDFADSFLKRHKNAISSRLAQNIKRARAQVTQESINEYFDNLNISLADVDPAMIVNYDETNLTDDPGRKKVITKRGCKYPERICNFSKTATSIMFAGSATGVILPVYVVYKATHMFDTWAKGGPHNARYNRTPSGWFDGNTFEDWVKTVAIPYFQDKEGKKILVGDNLSSHISLELVKICKQHNIHFVFLPSNSTHITQPLDVAFFRPLKMAWRDILSNWKATDGRKESTIPKSIFPRLLKKLTDKVLVAGEENLKAGFKKTGIYPMDRVSVLNQIPGAHNEHVNTEALNESVISLLKDLRYPNAPSDGGCKRKKKVCIEAGKSVTEQEIEGLAQTKTKQKNIKIKKETNSNVIQEYKAKRTKTGNEKSKTGYEGVEAVRAETVDLTKQQIKSSTSACEVTEKNKVVKIYDIDGMEITSPTSDNLSEPLIEIDQNHKAEEREVNMIQSQEINFKTEVIKTESTGPNKENVKTSTIKLYKKNCCACDYVEYSKNLSPNSCDWIKCISCKKFACAKCAENALKFEFICAKCFED